jgi:hypothetical protein
MTRRTEQYLLNYLQKKSLTMAASQEVNEASNLFYCTIPMKRLIAPELLRLRTLRKGHALAIADLCREHEAAAFDAYMNHLQEVSGAAP